MHHMRHVPLCVQERGFHRKKCRTLLSVTSGSPLPCHVILNFPPLCLSPCCWRVQWKMPESVEQMPLFFPWPWSTRAGPVSYVEAKVDLMLMDQRFHCLVFWRLFNCSMRLCQWALHRLDRSVIKRPYPSEIRNTVQLLSSHEEGGQRWLTDRERKSRSWPTVATETCDLYVCVHERERSKRMSVFFFSLVAQPGFSNVLLWNRNIERIDQLSYTPRLWDIASVLCNKRRKWKQRATSLWGKKSPSVR